jgi:hypothetical protein
VSKLRALFLVVGTIILIFPTTVFALNYPQSSVGQDVSWPNCNIKDVPVNTFGIVGVNGGLSFHPNHCLGYEAAQYRRNLSLYVNTGFPGSPYDSKFMSLPLECGSVDVNCLAYNYGYNAGKYAVNYSLSQGVVSNSWWLDVESINSWSDNTQVNRSSISGEIQAIKDSLKPSLIGFYGFPAGWSLLTSNWHLQYPDWVATNSNFKNVAVQACKQQGFSSPNVILTQYIGKTDLDLAC